MKFLAILSLITMMIIQSAHAGRDDGLYDPLPPPGSAFVRFVNATERDASATASLKTFGEVNPKNVTPYFVIRKGEVDIKFGEHAADMNVEEGQFYSVILNDGLLTLTDTPNAGRTKSQIQFYNLSNHETLQLKTSDGKIEITDPAAPNESRVRPINAVKLETALYHGDEQISEPSTINLKRGMVHSAFVFPDEDTVVWLMNRTAPIK